MMPVVLCGLCLVVFAVALLPIPDARRRWWAVALGVSYLGALACAAFVGARPS